MRLTKRPVDGVQVIASAGGSPPGRRRQSSAAWMSSGGRRAGSETANDPAATTAAFAAPSRRATTDNHPKGLDRFRQLPGNIVIEVRVLFRSRIAWIVVATMLL